MKNSIFFIKAFLLFSISISLFIACSSDDEQVQLTENEYPRIIGNWPERIEDGSLGTFSFTANDTLFINLEFTPSEYVIGVWYIDGEIAGTGKSFEFTETKATTHNLKLILSTSKYETSREATIIVTE